MTTTMTVNELLVELGSLAENKDVSIQRVGARRIEHYFDTFNTDYLPDTETTANILYYLTDIQMRDYALGLLEATKGGHLIPALEYLMEQAPVDSEYINAPSCLLSALYYEMYNTPAAFLALSTASKKYSLAQLLYRVYQAGWTPESFVQMRTELHPTVTEGIFGEGN
jgi:hypothetical protein